MLFRIGENKEAEIQNKLAYQFAVQSNNQKLTQEALLSQYFNYIMWNDELKLDSIDIYYRNLIEQYGDFANYNRARGFLHYNRQEYDLCIPAYINAIEVEMTLENPSKPVLYSLYYQLSEAYEQIGDFVNAFEIYNKADDERFSYISDLRRGEIYLTKFLKSRDEKDWTSSYNLLLRSDSLQYEQMKVVLEDDILYFFNYRNQINQLGMSLAHEWYVRDSSYESLEMFYSFSEKNKSALMQQEELLTRTSFIEDKQLRKEAISLNKKIKEANAHGNDFGAGYNSQIQRLENIYYNLENKSGELLIIDLPRLNELQKWSKDYKSQILSLNVIGNKIILMMVSPNGYKLEEIQFNDDVRIALDTILRYHSGESTLTISDYQKYVYIIYDSIFREVIDSFEKIVYSPDGIFNFLNIETLVSDTIESPRDFSELKYLIHDHEIRYSSNIRGVMKLQSEKRENGKIAVFAFTSSETLGSDLQLNELPGTIGSAKAIKKLHPDSEIYTGKRATKANFFKTLKDPEISTIHMAVHGAASGNTREDVKLFFRTPRGEIDTLYGYELMGLNTNANRVVLASCESAKGVYEVGEGAYTLTRYFKAMGVDEVVSQLWAAEDAAAAYIFKSYYKLKQLRKSKLKSYTINRFSDPRYWGNVISCL
ncbi:MAG: CHAT domain-containing protein [Saprospiraceae bacterium]|nr:CHAT domain-containing protein [Saprospiraceae bacterium]